MGTVPTAAAHLLDPLVVALVVGVLVLVLRWATRRGRSVVAAPPEPGRPDDYGLLASVAEPTDAATGRALCGRLVAAGVRANLVPTAAGLRIMVWPADVARARSVLAS